MDCENWVFRTVPEWRQVLFSFCLRRAQIKTKYIDSFDFIQTHMNLNLLALIDHTDNTLCLCLFFNTFQTKLSQPKKHLIARVDVAMVTNGGAQEMQMPVNG